MLIQENLVEENSLENINYYIHKNQEEINNKKIEKNKIDIDIENINNNLENLINLEEEKIKLQKEEVSEVKYFSKEDILNRISNNFEGLTEKTGPWNFLKRILESKLY